MVSLAALIAFVAVAEGGREVKGGPVDHAVVYESSISKEQPIRVRPFDPSNADVGKTGKKKYAHVAALMKDTAPTSLMNQLLEDLRAGGFSDVAELEDGVDIPENSIIIEGEFTVLNPGSRAKRYWAGMGAGKSRTCVKGRALDAKGEVLMEFDHCRFGAVGMFGGDSAKQMTTDAMRTGGRLGEFILKWANGEYVR
jgi:hypothetical protein